MPFAYLQLMVNIAMAQEIAERLSINPALMVGNPVINGASMPVALVLAKLAVDPALDAFFLDDPELTLADVKAVLASASTLAPKQEEGAATRQQGG